MKRVKLHIKRLFQPDETYLAQALTSELGKEKLYFYSTKKFAVDDELEIDCNAPGIKLQYIIRLNHLHEQISSGKIMNALPEEGMPFPAQKFFRCYGTVLSRNDLLAPVEAAATENAAPVEVTAESTVETPTEEIKPFDLPEAA